MMFAAVFSEPDAGDPVSAGVHCDGIENFYAAIFNCSAGSHGQVHLVRFQFIKPNVRLSPIVSGASLAAYKKRWQASQG